jgi:hypothetical protein
MNTPPLPDGWPVPTEAELQVWRAEADVQNALIAERDRLRAEREAVLAAPLTPLTIDGTTVEEVTASAQAAVEDLATQMQTKLDALNGL